MKKEYQELIDSVEVQNNRVEKELMPAINAGISRNYNIYKNFQFNKWKNMVPKGLYNYIISDDQVLASYVLEPRIFDSFVPIFKFTPIISSKTNVVQLVQLKWQVEREYSAKQSLIKKFEKAFYYVKENDLGTVANIFRDSKRKKAYTKQLAVLENSIGQIREYVNKVDYWYNVFKDLSKMSYSIRDVTLKDYYKAIYPDQKEGMKYYEKQHNLFDDIVFRRIKNVRDRSSVYDYDNWISELKGLWKILKEEQFRKNQTIVPSQYLATKYPALASEIEKTFNKHVTMLELSKMTEQEINNYFGIPLDKAKQIQKKATLEENKLYEKAIPKFTVDSLDYNKIRFLSLLKFCSNYSKLEIEKQHTLQKMLIAIDQVRSKINPSYFVYNFGTKEDYKKYLQYFPRLYKLCYKALELSDNLITSSTPESNPDKVRADFIANSAIYYSMLEKFTGQDSKYALADVPQEIVDEVNKFNLIEKDLKVTLRKYQVFGAKYILSYRDVLLGDEMGLGKTIQALTAINHLYQTGDKHAVIVCPLSILENWRQETKKWTTLPVYSFRKKHDYLHWVDTGGVLVTNYEQCSKIIKQQIKPNISMIVVDEAHYIKNPTTVRSKNVNKLLEDTKYRLLMTGTPIENNFNEMMQLIHAINSKVTKHIYEENARYILKHPTKTIMPTEKVKELLATVYLRRKRKDVLVELPKLSIINKLSTFNPVERRFYDAALEEGIGGLVKMRRAAFIDNNSEKISQIKELTQEAKEMGRKVIVFSYFKTSVLRKLSKLLPNAMKEVLSGDISPVERQRLIKCFEVDTKHNVLFSQIEAGGVGLNIQAASVVILCEPQWKPSIEKQAISRVYRMGQTRDVLVYKLLTSDSIDETIELLLDIKQNIFDTYANDSAIQEVISSRNIKKLQQKALDIEKIRLSKRKSSNK